MGFLRKRKYGHCVSVRSRNKPYDSNDELAHNKSFATAFEDRYHLHYFKVEYASIYELPLLSSFLDSEDMDFKNYGFIDRLLKSTRLKKSHCFDSIPHPRHS